jgi:twitching motility protein PilU
MDLSLNLKGVVSQRLVRKKKGGRIPAIEILLNTPMMADLILKGEVHAIKELISKSNEQGMCTFDQSLFRLIDAGIIDTQEGMRNADSMNELRLQLKLNSRFADKNNFFKGTENMSIEAIDEHEAS